MKDELSALKLNKIAEMRERSGRVVGNDRLQSFLYVLMRDHVTPGVIEELIDEDIGYHGQDILYTNGWLAKYAEDVAKRLKQ